MPLLIFQKLGMGELKPSTAALQLTDRSVRHPLGVLEDVLVNVGKFYFPVYFLVLEMSKDSNILIILGRPFLATGGALIDIQQGKLTLRMVNKTQEFNVFKAINSHFR